MYRGYEQLAAVVGPRLAKCTFKGYDLGDDRFTARRAFALNKVQDYARHLEDNVKAGKNLILLGTVGTGKDHLLAAMVRHALAMPIDTHYIRGSELCTQMRESYNERNTAVPIRFVEVPLLVISDIEPARDGVSKFEERALLELIDRRYNSERPICCTTNCETTKDLDAAIGSRAADRLLDNAVVAIMIWPSYRGSEKHGG